MLIACIKASTPNERYMHTHHEFPVSFNYELKLTIPTLYKSTFMQCECYEGLVELLEGACESINSDYRSADSASLVETLEEYLSERE